MNHHHRKLLHAIFAHPVSANLDPRQIHAALAEAGVEVTHGGHGQTILRCNGHSQGMHEAAHSLAKEEVVELRKFLTAAGIDPARDFPL
jgi:hypothetical protein